MLIDGHHYQVSTPTPNTVSVKDITSEVIGLLTIDHDLESANILSFFDDGTEDLVPISYYGIVDETIEEKAEVVVAYSNR